jgi:hypothetical protein
MFFGKHVLKEFDEGGIGYNFLLDKFNSITPGIDEIAVGITIPFMGEWDVGPRLTRGDTDKIDWDAALINTAMAVLPGRVGRLLGGGAKVAAWETATYQWRWLKWEAQIGPGNVPYNINTVGKALDDAQMFSHKAMLESGKGSYLSFRTVGKTIDVASHVEGGKLYIFGAPANGKFIWTIDAKGNFNIGMGDEMLGFAGGGGRLRGGRVSHGILAGGNDILGAGEVMFKNGEIIKGSLNTQTGHYAPILGTNEEIHAFNEQARIIFQVFARRVGLRYTEF